MKKLHSIALYTLLAPAITLSSGLALAQQTAGQDREQQSSQQQSSQRQPGATTSTPGASQSGSQAGASQGSQSTRAGQPDAETAAERRISQAQSQARGAGAQAQTERRGYLDSVPTSAMHADNLIGATVKTANDEEVGDVSDLIISQDGRVMAIVVGVGGFLGMGEKDVAIGWDDVMVSPDADDDEDNELQINMSRENLQSAPEFSDDNE